MNVNDGKTELTLREVFAILFRDPAVRAYVFTTLGALAMIFFVMFMNGSDIGGIFIVLMGTATLILRWTAVPPFLLIIIMYFQMFPFGIPQGGTESPYEVRQTHFRVVDMILVMAVLVYLRAQYRIFGFVHQIMPLENALKRKGDVATRRPSSHIQSDEIMWLVGIAGGIVLLGQAVWWGVNAIEFAPMDSDFPFRVADTESLDRYRREAGPGEFRPGMNRFLVILGTLFFGTLVLRQAFSYWRMRMMNATEGAMVLTDTSWAESHRERVRVEKWRIWGCQRAAAKAKQAEAKSARANTK